MRRKLSRRGRKPLLRLKIMQTVLKKIELLAQFNYLSDMHSVFRKLQSLSATLTYW